MQDLLPVAGRGCSWLSADSERGYAMEKTEMSALDAYLNRVYKIIVLMGSIAAMMAGVTFTVFKAVGWYDSVPVAALVFLI